MNFEQAKNQFIQAWGILGTAWGLNKTMAQIYALLMISSEVMSTEEIMQELQISRGNVNMNTRALIDWGLVSKVLKPGHRKEFFTCEKDVWQMAKQVAKERRKREIEPLKKVLNEVKGFPDSNDKDVKVFKKIIKDLELLIDQADSFLNIFEKASTKWYSKSVLKILKSKK